MDQQRTRSPKRKAKRPTDNEDVWSGTELARKVDAAEPRWASDIQGAHNLFGIRCRRKGIDAGETHAGIYQWLAQQEQRESLRDASSPRAETRAPRGTKTR